MSLTRSPKLKTKWHYIVVPKANGEGKNSKIKKVDQAKRWVQFTTR